MAVDTDLSTSLLQVRAMIGDTSSEMITDQTITALLLANDDNVNKTAIQSIQFIVADLAKQVHEEVGDLQVWANQRYEQYSDLLDKLLKDPAFMPVAAVHILGGTSHAEVCRVKGNSDSRNIKASEGFYPSQYEYGRINTNFLD